MQPPKPYAFLFVLPVAGCLFALLAWQLVRARLHSTEDGERACPSGSGRWGRSRMRREC